MSLALVISQALTLSVRLVGAAPKAGGKQVEGATDAVPSLTARVVLATWCAWSRNCRVLRVLGLCMIAIR